MITRKMLWRCLTLAIVPLSTAACGLLDVEDPTVVEESDVANPGGADLMRPLALANFYNAIYYATHYGALYTDELMAVPTQGTLLSEYKWTDLLLNMRDTEGLKNQFRGTGGYPHTPLQEARLGASHVINWYRKYGIPSQRPYLGQLYAVRGHAALLLAEQVCAGFALHDVVEGRPRYSPPVTTQKALEYALADLDSAIALTADSARFLNFAKVSRGRTLLAMGKFAEAAQAVAGVPTSYVYNGEYGAFPAYNFLTNLGQWGSWGSDDVTVGDGVGGNGLNFVSANDPRVQVTDMGLAEDGVTHFYVSTKYPASNSPITIASGIEARLIEAEAQLKGAAAGSWLTTLNDLRATQITPALPALTDPGTADARIDLLFRERAFWLYLTGHRLGDMRRLIAHHGRSATSVFPSGPYHSGGSYGSATSIPFMPVGEQYAKTGVTGCTE